MMTYQEWREAVTKGRDDIDFGRLMQYWRIGHNCPGRTLEEFSATYGVPLRTVHNWLSGARNPPPYVVQALVYAVASDGVFPL